MKLRAALLVDLRLYFKTIILCMGHDDRERSAEDPADVQLIIRGTHEQNQTNDPKAEKEANETSPLGVRQDLLSQQLYVQGGEYLHADGIRFTP